MASDGSFGSIIEDRFQIKASFEIQQLFTRKHLHPLQKISDLLDAKTLLGHIKVPH